MSEMTAAISPPFNAGAKSTRPPSETPSHRRVKTRDVASRYLDTTTSSFSSSSLFQSSPAKRCQSPTVTRTNRPATPSQSATIRPQSSTGRRQSVTPRRDSSDRRGGSGGEEVSAAERMLLASGRGLFASFQADSFTGHENRSKLNSSPRTSVGTQQEKSKLSEQWPRSLKPRHCLSRSVDFTDTMKIPSGSCNGVTQSSMASNRPVSHGRTMSDSTIVGSFSMISDAESVSCGSSNGRRRNLPASGVVVKARFSEPCSPVARCNGTRKLSVDSSKREQIRDASPGKFGMSMSLASSSPRGSSIGRGISPSRGVTVPPRGMMSPLRVRSTTTPLVLSFAKKENSVADDAHLLRLLHNRLLQWRFANARANAAITAQKMRAEKRLYNAWNHISKLYDSVRAKRIEMQHLKHNLKLLSILIKQMTYLEEWLVMDRDHTSSLVGAAEALRGSTLYLPVDYMATVNVQSVKDAICSAVDVMQAMASSICLLLPKVVKVSGLAVELNRVNVKEQRMLELCRDFLNIISALEVVECSLRTQAIQIQY
ncbi:unnamed protein product [Microthlaspi erraticum]|uniref:Uncharacterized protein n=1 Tax=Microthlaspi erraticum TaxID=1685480 RepID=A0A6D2K0A6_9BRAS|nr:unnamed protein product [Microthlaspi erraticum]